jgi:cytochrome c-type biogenesis protein CcmH/NrfG/rRNA maturation endonuclease Nob1
MNKIVVLDTNVLLADPNSVLSFPRAEVVVPETVLSELDKLKTARVDPDLRFRGREVSRILFDLSEEGSLIEGVELPDGGSLRVIPFESDMKDLPEGISQRNADDRILITALQVNRDADEDTEVRLITNDLNMLLKAQTLGINVERYGDGVEGGFAKRYIIRPFQRYRVPITILAVALAVFVGVVVIAMYSQQGRIGNTGIPAEFKGLLTANQLAAYDAINALATNPNDTEALLRMGNIYFDANEAARQTDAGAAINYGQQGIRYYERYLKLSPQDNDARADLATLYFATGQTDRAIQEVGTVLQRDKNHIKANYNLGLFYAQGRRDYPAAEAQFRKIIELTQNDPQQHAVFQQATVNLAQVKKLQSQSLDTSGAKK